MKKVAAAVLSISLGIGAGACGKSKPSQQVQQDTQQAQQIVSGCVAKGNLLTHDGRLAIIQCIAPPGHEAQFQTCAATQLSKANVFTQQGRSNYEQALAICVEQNR